MFILRSKIMNVFCFINFINFCNPFEGVTTPVGLTNLNPYTFLVYRMVHYYLV